MWGQSITKSDTQIEIWEGVLWPIVQIIPPPPSLPTGSNIHVGMQ